MTGINREPSPYWKNKEYSVDLGSVSPGSYNDLLGRRVTDSYAAFQQDLARRIYGDDQPYIQPSRWKRFMNWLGDNRVTNAWLVLIGREDIDREYR